MVQSLGVLNELVLDTFVLFQDISVRNVHDWTDKVIPLSDFICKSRTAGAFAEENGALCFMSQLQLMNIAMSQNVSGSMERTPNVQRLGRNGCVLEVYFHPKHSLMGQKMFSDSDPKK